VTDYAKLHAAKGDYEIKVEEAWAMSLSTLKTSEAFWHAAVVFRDETGRITSTGIYKEMWVSSDPRQKRVRASLARHLNRYRRYRETKGHRLEIEHQEARAIEARAAREARLAAHAASSA